MSLYFLFSKDPRKINITKNWVNYDKINITISR